MKQCLEMVQDALKESGNLMITQDNVSSQRVTLSCLLIPNDEKTIEALQAVSRFSREEGEKQPIGFSIDVFAGSVGSSSVHIKADIQFCGQKTKSRNIHFDDIDALKKELHKIRRFPKDIFKEAIAEHVELKKFNEFKESLQSTATEIGATASNPKNSMAFCNIMSKDREKQLSIAKGETGMLEIKASKGTISDEQLAELIKTILS